MNKERLVCGIGVNDAGYEVTVSEVVDGKPKIVWRCPYHTAWRKMLDRCYSAKWHESRPTYLGCSVAPEWHSFSAFRAWMASQDWEGKQLDKDILFPGNKVYSPDTCAFVAAQVNLFMTDSGAARGDWPIGVNWDKARGQFKSQCSNPVNGKQENLGRFICPEAAHEAWRARKHEHALAYADQQTDPRIAAAMRSRYARPYMEERP